MKTLRETCETCGSLLNDGDHATRCAACLSRTPLTDKEDKNGVVTTKFARSLEICLGDAERVNVQIKDCGKKLGEPCGKCVACLQWELSVTKPKLHDAETANADMGAAMEVIALAIGEVGEAHEIASKVADRLHANDKQLHAYRVALTGANEGALLISDLTEQCQLLGREADRLKKEKREDRELIGQMQQQINELMQDQRQP